MSAAWRIGSDLTVGHSFPVVTTGRFLGPSTFSAARMTAALQGYLFAGGRVAEPLHDAFLSRGRRLQRISDQGGGGRDHEDWWLEDRVDSIVQNRDHI